MNNYIILLLKLYWEFFKTGLFSVGGGLATLPFLSEISSRTGWFSQTDLSNMIAVAESTPGPIGVNTATYVGYSTAGILGGIISTLGLVTPSLIIILIIAKILDKFKENRFVKYTFHFLRPASAGLILSALVLLTAMTFFADGTISINTLSVSSVVLALLIYVLTNYIKPLQSLHPIIWIGLSAIAGIIIL